MTNDSSVPPAEVSIRLCLGTMVLDADDTVLHADQTFSALTGYAREAFPTFGNWLERVVPADDARTSLAGKWREWRAQGGKHMLDFPVVRPDGTASVLKGQVAFSDSGVAVLTLEATGSDPMELASLLLAKQSMDQASILILWIDGDGSLLYANGAALNSLGHGRDDFRGLHLWDMEEGLAEGDWPGFLAGMAERGVMEGRRVLRRKDGSRLHVDLRSQYHERDGNPLLFVYAVDITKAVEAEKALRESEERYRLVVKGANDGVWDWDLEKGEVFFSRRYKEILGFEDMDFGDSAEVWSGRIHPEDKDKVLEANTACIRGEAEQFEVEYRMRHRDGGWRWILGRGAGLADDSGRIRRMTGTHTDITKRKRAEEELRISEQYYRSLFENTGLATVIYGDSRIIRECNTRFEELSAMKGRDIEGRMRWTDFVAEEDLARMRRYHDQRVANGDPPPDEYDFVFVDAEGRRKDCHVKVSVIPETNDRIACLQDISERLGVERTTKALFRISTAVSTTRDLGELYAAIHSILNEFIDATNFFISVVDEERDMLTFPYYSDEYDEFYDFPGVSDTEVKSLTLHVIRTGEIMYLREHEIRELVDRGVLGIVGSYPAVWLGVPLIIEGRVIGVMAVQHYESQDHYGERDVQLMAAVSEQVALALERKANEKALTRMNEELEAKVRERTRELANKAQELKLANERLLELDKVKSRLLSSVSHELRTPLTSIQGFARICNRDFLRHFHPGEAFTGKEKERADRILENLAIVSLESERLTRLINDFLDLSKIESGNMDWKDSLVDVAGAVQAAVSSIRGEFEDRASVALLTHIPHTIPPLLIDPDRLQQVLINLLGNAAKFTESGRIEICAACREGTLRLEVRDSGIGIEPSELTRLFASFYTPAAGDTVKHRREGTGLGLAICREIIQHYGGIIWAESTPGAGSVFFCELPVGGQG